MAEEKQLTQEERDDQMINEAFQKLLDDYISSRHRKKVDLITKAFNFARQAHKGVRQGCMVTASSAPSILATR